MYAFLLYLLSIVHGGFRFEPLEENVLVDVVNLKPKVETFLTSQGYNGIFPEGPIEEVWGQLVNGKNYIVKIKDGYNYLCIRYFKSFDGYMDFETAKPCTSMKDLI